MTCVLREVLTNVSAVCVCACACVCVCVCVCVCACVCVCVCVCVQCTTISHIQNIFRPVLLRFGSKGAELNNEMEST